MIPVRRRSPVRPKTCGDVSAVVGVKGVRGVIEKRIGGEREEAADVGTEIDGEKVFEDEAEDEREKFAGGRAEEEGPEQGEHGEHGGDASRGARVGHEEAGQDD